MAKPSRSTLQADRYFSSDPQQKQIARELYASIEHLPLVCPHGHVDPRTFADPDFNLGTPTDLFLIPDHYIFRMLYSQGISLECLGIPAVDGAEVESEHRAIWQIFAENFHLFRGTPTGTWLTQELYSVFGVDEKLTGETAQSIYDHIAEQLTRPEFRPRRLFERFNIEVLATTDAASDPLEHHRAIKESGWKGRVVPTFRPDGVVNIDRPDWREQIDRLSDICGFEINSTSRLISALEQRRAFFKEMGSTSTDHAALTPYTAELSEPEADQILHRALEGTASESDAMRFTGFLLMENARMCVEDGLVMQLHVGSYRNHNRAIFERFGADKGGDIPIPHEFTCNLAPLLNRYGNDARLTLILFTLDESTYARELAPLAGHYPAVKLGPPWWFNDSIEGMTRFRQCTTETAGIYNTAGFNDDTRAFCSIPARHDLARRVDANFLGGLVARHRIDMVDARAMARALAYDLEKETYRL